MVEQRIIEIAKSYINELKNNGIEITAAYLYGSHTTNQATVESDIDILLVSPQFENQDEESILAKIWFSKIRTENRIEPILINSNRFERDDYSPIIALVKEQGILIAA